MVIGAGRLHGLVTCGRGAGDGRVTGADVGAGELKKPTCFDYLSAQLCSSGDAMPVRCDQLRSLRTGIGGPAGPDSLNTISPCFVHTFIIMRIRSALLNDLGGRVLVIFLLGSERIGSSTGTSHSSYLLVVVSFLIVASRQRSGMALPPGPLLPCCVPC